MSNPRIACCLAVNIARRHMTAGPRAIVLVRAMKVTQFVSTRSAARQFGIPQQRISQANVIIEFLSVKVVDGILTTPPILTFDQAYADADLDALAAEAPDTQINGDHQLLFTGEFVQQTRKFCTEIHGTYRASRGGYPGGVPPPLGVRRRGSASGSGRVLRRPGERGNHEPLSPGRLRGTGVLATSIGPHCDRTTPACTSRP